jgi:hypothetical protein
VTAGQRTDLRFGVGGARADLNWVTSCLSYVKRRGTDDLVCLSVGKHGAVDGVRDPELEGPNAFLAGGTGFLSAIEVGPGVGPRTSLGEGDSVNRG